MKTIIRKINSRDEQFLGYEFEKYPWGLWLEDRRLGVGFTTKEKALDFKEIWDYGFNYGAFFGK